MIARPKRKEFTICAERFNYNHTHNCYTTVAVSSVGMQFHLSQQTVSLAFCLLTAKLLSYIGKSSSTGGSKSSKDSCPFCKEQKKRPLGAYMRKRGQRITTESISEDAEECNEEELREEDEEEDVCASNRGTTLSTSPSGDHHQHMHRGITGVPGFNRQESIEGK